MTILKKRTAIVAFMLVAVLAMGIGFAAYSTTLTVNGTAGVDAEAVEFTKDVIFTGATVDDATFAEASASGQYGTFRVFGMTQRDERVHITYTIQNNSDVDVSVVLTAGPTTGATNSKFTVTSGLNNATTIPAGQSTTVVVTVVLNETVTEAVAPVNYVIEYTATGLDG